MKCLLCRVCIVCSYCIPVSARCSMGSHTLYSHNHHTIGNNIKLTFRFSYNDRSALASSQRSMRRWWVAGSGTPCEKTMRLKLVKFMLYSLLVGTTPFPRAIKWSQFHIDSVLTHRNFALFSYVWHNPFHFMIIQ